MMDRRRQLWDLLGDLPEAGEPTGEMVGSHEVDGGVVEHWVLELNGVEAVPAWLLLPSERKDQASGLLYAHSHGGHYESGKDELFAGAGSALMPYGLDLIKRGIVTLAIDSWCFGERQHDDDGQEGERDAFCKMLWNGQNLFGMMMFDEHQALTWLASRSDVDSSKLGVLGMSMGATKAWWLAALDERVSLCVDICCLTDFDSLIEHNGIKRHSLYYYVPGLLKHFSSPDINAMIAPRPRISVNGSEDALTPVDGIDRIRQRLINEYGKHDAADHLSVRTFPCGHQELPEMRELSLQWLDRYLVE
jgi:dienelactone hydrolase